MWFRQALREVLNDGFKKIVVHVGEVTHMDSSGIGELVGGYTTAAAQGAQLCLANAGAKMKGLLQLTKLVIVFPSFQTVEAALSAYER